MRKSLREQSTLLPVISIVSKRATDKMCMEGGMVQNSRNQNRFQHQQPTCSSTFSFKINNKIRPTSTANTITNNESKSTPTTIPLVFNNESPQNQHRTEGQLQQPKIRPTIWGRATGYGRGRLGPKKSIVREIEDGGRRSC